MDRLSSVETQVKEKGEWVTPELSRMGVEETLSGFLTGPIEDVLNRLKGVGGGS